MKGSQAQSRALLARWRVLVHEADCERQAQGRARMVEVIGALDPILALVQKSVPWVHPAQRQTQAKAPTLVPVQLQVWGQCEGPEPQESPHPSIHLQNHDPVLLQRQRLIWHQPSPQAPSLPVP